MPIDPTKAIGASLPSQSFSWTSSDVLLYHLGIGAGARPGDATDPAALRYTLDSDALTVLPSFGVVAPTFHVTEPPSLDLPGCDIDLASVLHGSQEIHVDGPIPTSGDAVVSTRIAEVWDKGKAAVMGRTYAGPGATIGPALVFGYLAAEDCALKAVSPEESN
jgi:hypothetical protein